MKNLLEIYFEIYFENNIKTKLVLISSDFLTLKIIFAMRNNIETQSLKPHE